ncbi:hypothetical protein GO730_37980 [Spirosoma sp. HMF3257]|uniref:Uncharacterized protein n=1 Tax=Spirosoma telluris TaxID=2183553 RepID=A0A327ND20_9BACT|nr:hypothetical protein [Spirosoma telluris]RAI73160.1 hypothetical protein HMF3257_37880 [Spirosoma telluris]
MAYLTKYNLSQLSQKLDINLDISLEMFLQHVYDDPEIYSVLNKREIEYLFKYKMLLEDEENFVIEFYNEVPEKEDTKSYVFNKGGKMKYHLSSSCPLINKDYLDFNIPEEIKSIGDNAIQEYREWFNQNKFGDRYRSKQIDKNVIIAAFNLKYPNKYDIKPIEDNSNLLIIEQPNSSIKMVEQSYDFEKGRREITKLKYEWQKNFPCGVTKTIAKFKYLLTKDDEEIKNKISELFSINFIKNYGLEKLKIKFKISKYLTNRIITLILDHIKWAYDINEKRFDDKTLEKFGLECCLTCLKEAKMINAKTN